MNPKKMVRTKQCQSGCEYFLNNRQVPWPRCMHPDTRSNPRGWLELRDDAFDGPDSDCPDGQWAGLDETEADEYLKKVGYYDEVPKRQFIGKNETGVVTPFQNEVAKRQVACRVCDRTSCPLHNCTACFEKARLNRASYACLDVGTPRWLPLHPGWVDPIKVIFVISAWNDPHVAETIKQMRESIIDPAIEFDVILVDDGSDKEDYSTLDCTVIRNDKPMGIGYNLNIGTKKAIEMGADVIGVSDAHMKILAGAVDYLARRAMVEDCVTCSATYGWDEKSAFAQWAAYLVKMPNNLIEPKWLGGKWPFNEEKKFFMPEEEWAQVQVPLGAFYAYSKATVNRLMEPTGRLWETPVGLWGFLLAPFSAKAHLLDIPVYVSRDHYTRHLYRRANPCPTAGSAKVYNIAFGMASIFSEETLETYMFGKTKFQQWCVSRGGVDGRIIMKHIKEARKGVKRPWTPEDEVKFLDSIPHLHDEKKGPEIPLEKIRLKRDKMTRGSANKAAEKEDEDGLDTQVGEVV